ncbi:MAG: hypothetical protein JNL28_10605 [Planctomycetes bacterium]|nr:hypothetical protein [Planctomycetota bacterium]
MAENETSRARRVFRGRERARTRHNRQGITMLEVSLALTILVIALVATTASNMRMHSLQRSNRDRVVAQNAVQAIAETVQAIARKGVTAPNGFGNYVVTALAAGGELGPAFDVPELNPVAGETRVGSVVVITDETSSDGTLGAALGLPRDLNGDGDALDTNVTASAHLLPVVITLRWRNQAGDQRIVHPFYVFGY